MFDLGAGELLLVVIVAVIVIGPKDLPLAMRTAGRWIGKMRRLSGHFRSGIDAMVREAELDEMEAKWKAQNDAIMKAHPSAAQDDSDDLQAPVKAAEAPAEMTPHAVSAEAAIPSVKGAESTDKGTAASRQVDKPAEPQLPLPPP